MKKKGVPTEITFQREWQAKDSVGNPTGKKIFYYNIKFDNGDKGYFSTNVNPQTKFTLGQSIDYTYEQDKNKDNTDKVDKFNNPVMKVDKWKEPFIAGAGKKVMSKPHENRSIAASVALECSIDYLKDKQGITQDLIRLMSDFLYAYLIKDNICFIQEVDKWDSPEIQLSIQKQAALRRAVQSSALLDITSKEKLIIVSDYYNEFINKKSNM